MYHSDVKNYIHEYPDFFDKGFCNQLINSYEDGEPWHSAVSYGDKDVRKQKVKKIDNPYYSKYIYDQLKPRIDEYCEMYGVVIKESYGFDLLKYEVGDYFDVHYDGQGRSLSLIALLTDDFEGGEIIFFDDYKPTVKKGTGIIFPANFIYHHYVTPVTSGTRYTVVTWLY